MLNEDLIDLREAAQLPIFRRRGRAPHISVLYRWIHAGIVGRDGDRARLEVVKCPGGLKTSTQAVARFIGRLSGTDMPVPTPRAHQRAVAQAEAELAAAGYST